MHFGGCACILACPLGPKTPAVQLAGFMNCVCCTLQTVSKAVCPWPRAAMVAPTAAVLCGLIIALHLLPHRAEVSQCAVSDFEGALARFSSALRAQTISGDVSKASEWQQLHSLISRSYPATQSTLTVERVSRDSLLLTWPGTDRELAPVLFLSHFDVVPVTDDVSWTHPPFSGAIADGYVWGRGAIDLKVTAVSLLEAVEELVKAAQFTPRRTIAIAIGHDEESRSGEGAGGAAAACCSAAGGAGRWQHAPPAQPLATPAQRNPAQPSAAQPSSAQPSLAQPSATQRKAMEGLERP